jgi:hypothetical protein
MKTLDLTIYEKHPTLDAYRFGPSFTPYAVVAKDKRFTDAELAATYFMVHSTVMQFLGYMDKRGSVTDLKARDAQRRLEIIERFATLPHYDEETP